MTVAKHSIRRAPNLHDSIKRGNLFSDAALKISPSEAIRDSPTISRIGKTVAKKCGVNLQFEGDIEAKKVVSVAYDVLDDVTRRSFEINGVDRTAELFTSDQTHDTLGFLSGSMNNLALMKLVHRYQKGSTELALNDEGLTLGEGFILSDKMKTQRDGCPYANGTNPRYFNLFSDHIIETLAKAHQSGLPINWLDRVNRTLHVTN